MPMWLQKIIVRFEWLEAIYYRYYCPRPIGEDLSARACDNAARYGH